MEISALSLSELQKLKTKIEKEIEGRNKKQRGQAMDEIKSIVAKYGLKLEEVISKASTPKRGSGLAKKAAKVAKPAKKSAAILFCHPDNPALTWSGGRGRRPQWIKDWEAAGRSLDEARVASASKEHQE